MERFDLCEIIFCNKLQSDVVIFDEPTSALDSRTEQLIVEMISSIEDKMIIVVSHSSCFVDCVDHIYRIG